MSGADTVEEALKALYGGGGGGTGTGTGTGPEYGDRP